jgi:hypothetical protein
MLERAAVGPDMLLEGKDATAREVSLDPARVDAWTESVAAGRCVRVTVGAQGEGAGVELRAYDAADGAEMDRAAAAHATSVRACAAEAARKVRFEVRASAGKLDAVVGERTTGKD